MLTEVGHIVMAVRNLPACRAHYGEALGLPEIDGSSAEQCAFRIGPAILELRLDSAAPDAVDARPVVDHFALLVDDLDRVYTALRERAVDFLAEPATTALGHRNMQRALATLSDPEGFHLQLSQTVDPRPHLEARRSAKRHMAGVTTGLFGGIDHISTYCTDFARTRDFYTRQLGLEEFFHSTTREEGQVVVPGFAQSAFAVGGTDIELAVYDTQTPVRPDAVRQLGFATDDVDRAFRDLQDRGLVLDGPPAEQAPLPGLRQRAFTLRSPDGLQIQIAQAL